MEKAGKRFGRDDSVLVSARIATIFLGNATRRFSKSVVQKYHRMLNKITIVRCYSFIHASCENVTNL